MVCRVVSMVTDVNKAPVDPMFICNTYDLVGWMTLHPSTNCDGGWKRRLPPYTTPVDPMFLRNPGAVAQAPGSPDCAGAYSGYGFATIDTWAGGGLCGVVF